MSVGLGGDLQKIIGEGSQMGDGDNIIRNNIIYKSIRKIKKYKSIRKRIKVLEKEIYYDDVMHKLRWRHGWMCSAVLQP